MPKATTTTTTPTRRRGLLSAAAMLFAGAAASAHAAPAGADAELIAAVAQMARHHVWIEKYEASAFEECEAAWAHFESVHDAWWDAAHQVEALTATTREGIRAKAQALQMMLQLCVLTRPDYSLDDAEHHERLAYKLATEILALD